MCGSKSLEICTHPAAYILRAPRHLINPCNLCSYSLPEVTLLPYLRTLGHATVWVLAWGTGPKRSRMLAAASCVRACGPSRFATACQTLGCQRRTRQGQRGPALRWGQEGVQSRRCRSLQAHGGPRTPYRSRGRGQPWPGRRPRSLCRRAAHMQGSAGFS